MADRLRTTPKKPLGWEPKKRFTDSAEPFGLKVATVIRVDEINLKADLKIMTGGSTERFEVDLTQPMAGQRSFFGGLPEEGSLCIVGYRRKAKNLYEAMILGYIPIGNRIGLGFHPLAPTDPTNVTEEEAADVEKMLGPTVRYKRMKLKSGDIGGMSAEGSEFHMDRNIRLTNRAGDFMELREADRTFVASSVHRAESESGVLRLSGPIRRGGFYLPPDIFGSDGKTLLTTDKGYFGTDNLQNGGPGQAGDPTRFANADGKVLDLFNNTTEFPPVTYNNGRQVFYPANNPAVNFESLDGAGAEAFTEWRMEMSHTTDCTQEVREEIDGFQMDRRRVYIEHAMGTIVGNDLYSTMGQRQYGRVLKPKIFDSFDQANVGKFELQEVPRPSTEPDQEVNTTAGAFMFRIAPPQGTGTEFVASVSKQGKFFLSAPGSVFERYPDGQKNISGEISLDGALKAYIGASSPDNVSLAVTLQGGISADIGHTSSRYGGSAMSIRYHSPTQFEWLGGGVQHDDFDAVRIENVQGNQTTLVAGDCILNAKAVIHTADGGHTTQADQIVHHANSGYTANLGEIDITCAGKSQYNYALVVLENIALGGKIANVLAGAVIQNIVAGAYTCNTLAGATLFNNPAGAFTVTVGTGAVAITTAGGAISMAAAAGAVAATAGLAMTMTAGLAVTITGVTVSLVAPQILLGGPPAVLGVCRGIPMMPPGTPSLDWITGLPLQGCSVVRSL